MIKTFIYGSCVSRDTFEYLDQQRFSLVNYVARQSLISAFTAIDESELPEAVIDSPFQRRMVEADWSASLVNELRNNRDQIDLILWDLCDERHGVRQILRDPPSFATRSVESISSGIDRALSNRQHLNLGDPEHLQLFSDRMLDLDVLLESLDLKDKVLVIAPQWASVATDGTPTPRSFTWTASAANTAYVPYYEAVRQVIGPPIIDLPTGLVVGDSLHRWGPAPFHYTAAAYQHLANAVEEWAGRP